MKKKDLFDILFNLLAEGRLETSRVLPVLKAIREGESVPGLTGEVISELRKMTDPGTDRLVSHILDAQKREAQRFFKSSGSGEADPESFRLLLGDLPLDAPSGWKESFTSIDSLQKAILLAQDYFYILRKAGLLDKENPGTGKKIKPITAVIEEEFRKECLSLKEHPSVWEHILPEHLIQKLEETGKPGYPDLCGRLRELNEKIKTSRRETAAEALKDLETADPETVPVSEFLDETVKKYGTLKAKKQKQNILDMLACWPDDLAAPYLVSLVETEEEKDRIHLIFTLRFGNKGYQNWTGWERMIHDHNRRISDKCATILERTEDWNGLLLYLWYTGLDTQEQKTAEQLHSICAEHAPLINPEKFIRRWSSYLAPGEWNLISGVKPAPEEEPPARIKTVPRQKNNVRPEKTETKPAKPAVKIPSLWDDHIRPFFVANWYMVAGIIMVVAGSSLLAYYTWDKHWLLRYTIMPLLLGLFTGGLAWTGSWIEKKNTDFRGMAVMLRGAAIGLLPINFMAVALMANDPRVSMKHLAVPGMGLLYLIIFGWGLSRWCRKVHEKLTWVLAGTLLLLNSLVTLAPLARTLGSVQGRILIHVLGIGFHIGFILTAVSVIHFTKSILTREMAENKTVPWFFGASLTVTFVQVFGWVHGYMRHVPEVYTYAPLIILAGWLILYVERRTLQLLSNTETHTTESFLGFAMIGLGILMGVSDQYIRILAFILAGSAWVFQACYRRHPLHYWIGLILLAAGVSSASLLDIFPGSFIPAAGIAAAVLMGIIRFASGRRDQLHLKEAAAGMQSVILFFFTGITILAQWHYNSAPLLSAVWLTVICAMIFRNAFRDKKLYLVHSGAVIAALVLPYLGCIDLKGKSFFGNTMVFGLAVLSWIWISLTSFRPVSLLKKARSTVLFTYGALAVTAMILRVIIERGTPSDALWYRSLMDFSGPLLMTASLAMAAYFSKSLVPSAMGAVIAAVLYPELKAQFQELFEHFGFGSGLGSSSSALIIMISCFFLRKAGFLKDMKEADLFAEKHPFPFQRFDHTLFTLPLVLSALFLTVKVETWNIIQNLHPFGTELKTAIGLIITGVVWTLFAVYSRKQVRSVMGIHFGWIWLFVGILLGYKHLFPGGNWTFPYVCTGVILQVLFIVYRFTLSAKFPWVKELLADSTQLVLTASGFLFSIISIGHLLYGTQLVEIGWFAAFGGIQLIRYALEQRKQIAGYILFPLVWAVILAWTSPGSGFLAERVFAETSLWPTLFFLAGIQTLLLGCEFSRKIYNLLTPLLVPFQVVAAGLSVLLGITICSGAVFSSVLTHGQLIMTGALLFITARAQICGPLAFLGACAVYVLAHYHLFANISPDARLRLLFSPWHISLFSLALSGAGWGGRQIEKLRPAILKGPYSLPFFKTPVLVCFYIPAAALAIAGSMYHTFSPVLREEHLQVIAPILGSLAFLVIALDRGTLSLFSGPVILFSLANIHVVRVFAGNSLRTRGLSEVHLICLGLILSAVIYSIIRIIFRKKTITLFLSNASLILALLVLVMLSVNYFTHPDLESISTHRYIISGIMSLLAGLYFRWSARNPVEDSRLFSGVCEGLYHFGLTMAIWCTVLLIPWFRTPATALIALGLPVFYFYLQAEIGRRLNIPTAARYCSSAAVLGLIILALYVFRSAFQMILFPDLPVHTDHYHNNSFYIIALSIILLRLHGLGGTGWLSFYGGLGLMCGSYFALTFLPGLSPFRFPVPSAWAAIALGHFWTLVSVRRSPLKTGIQRLAGIDEPRWHELRRVWGVWVAVACQVAFLWGLTDFNRNTYAVLPLFLGAASILLHHGIIRQAPLYFIAGGLEIAAALHMDFIIPSYLPKEDIIWVILGGWIVTAAVFEIRSKFAEVIKTGTAAAVFAGALMAHVLYRNPWSPAGLWAAVLGTAVGVLTLRKSREAGQGSELGFALIPLAVPAWIVYFTTAPIESLGLDAVFMAWPILAVTAAILLTGAAVKLFKQNGAEQFSLLTVSQPRLFHQTLSWAAESADSFYSGILWVTFILTALVQVRNYGAPFAPLEFLFILGLYGTLSFAWYHEGLYRKHMAPYIALQVCLLGFFAVIRRQIMLSLGVDQWNYQYDVWVSLLVSLGLTGTKQIIDLKPREVRVPVMTTMFTLPGAALIWVLLHHLGTNTAMLVIGLQSLMFSYMGKEKKDSPYNILAVFGFTACTLIAFYDKLNLRVLHAYIIPVGLAILILLQLFRDKIEPHVRNSVRLLVLAAMLGSSGYYALIDPRFPLAFNMTLIVLSLASMALGSFLRIRLYLVLGFSALCVDLASIIFKVLRNMERSLRMTAVGSIVLVIGAGLIFGAIYFKTHQEEISRRIDSLRRRFGEWE